MDDDMNPCRQTNVTHSHLSSTCDAFDVTTKKGYLHNVFVHRISQVSRRWSNVTMISSTFVVRSSRMDVVTTSIFIAFRKRPYKAYPVELAHFHLANYVEFLQRINQDTQHLFPEEMAKFKLGEDCPVFDDLFEFCQIYACGTIGHAECVRIVKKFNFPLLVTGGGGYTQENVARCWTVETGVLLDTELRNEILDNDYIKDFAPECSLRIPSGHIEIFNSKSYLGTIKMQVMENLRCIQHAPSVQMQEVPPDFYNQ